MSATMSIRDEKMCLENTMEMSEEMNEEIDWLDYLTFTRYLYPANSVKHSLVIALLERNPDEALFWTYELYYSGFEEDTFTFIKRVYEMFYKKHNPLFAKFIDKMADEGDCGIGSIVKSLTYKKYDVSQFVETMFDKNNVDILNALMDKKCAMEQNNPLPVKKSINVVLTKEDIDKYQTITVIKPRDVLRNACSYSVRTYVADLFAIPLPDTIIDCYMYDWLYYASRSPIWKERILCMNGIIDNNKHTVVFADDDDREDFYETWGYEPDEQTIDIQLKCIGALDTFKLDIAGFCQRYLQ